MHRTILLCYHGRLGVHWVLLFSKLNFLAEEFLIRGCDRPTWGYSAQASCKVDLAEIKYTSYLKGWERDSWIKRRFVSRTQGEKQRSERISLVRWSWMYFKRLSYLVMPKAQTVCSSVSSCGNYHTIRKGVLETG